MQSKYAVCRGKKKKIYESKVLLSSLGVKTPLNKILFFGDILFYVYQNDILCV